MSIGSQIASYRKKLNITQDTLARKLDVTNQAVSKWETDQCYPDITLLPKLADIFECTMDALFQRTTPTPNYQPLPWEEDDTLHIAVFHGRKLIESSEACKNLTFQYEGPALNVDCALNLQCQSIGGNVHSGGSVTCDGVGGNIHAGGNVTCDCVGGDVRAGGNITCDEIFGSSSAGGSIYCDEINMEGSRQSVHIHRTEAASKETPNPFCRLFKKK